MLKKALAFTFIILLQAQNALAIQEHGDPEGYFVHQLAHIIFIAAMIFMIAVLRRPSSISKLAGWRSIRYASFFFMLWNVDAFIGHMGSYRMGPREEYINGSVLLLKDSAAKIYYYFSLAEYFFLVPGFVFLAIGLNQLWKDLKKEGGE